MTSSVQDENVADDHMEIAADWVDELDTLSPERRQVLEAWLAASEANAAAFVRMRRLLQDPSLLEAAEGVRSTTIAQPSTAPESQPRRRPAAGRREPRRRTLIGAGLALAAACMTLAVFVISPWRAPPPQSTPRGQDYATAIGKRADIALSDASMIRLNADSHVDVVFTDRARDIRLDRGEARFEVAHNAARPFRVAAGDVTVTAVGTVFDVDRVSGAVAIRVFEGAVKVARTGQAPSLVRKGQWMMLAPDQQPTAGAFEPAGYQDWRTDWLQADRMPLKYAIARLNRYSAQPIALEDPAMANVPITGRFNLRNTDTTLAMMSALLKLKAVHDGRGVHLEPAVGR